MTQPLAEANFERLAQGINANHEAIGRLHETVDAFHEQVAQTRGTVDATHEEVLVIQDMIRQLPEQQEEDGNLGMCELIREGVIFAGRYFLFGLSRQGIEGSEILRELVVAECIRHDIPAPAVAAFEGDQRERFDLLSPHLLREIVMVMNYFCHQMDGNLALNRQDTQAIAAHLASFDYPQDIPTMPFEERRMACLH